MSTTSPSLSFSSKLENDLKTRLSAQATPSSIGSLNRFAKSGGYAQSPELPSQGARVVLPSQVLAVEVARFDYVSCCLRRSFEFLRLPLATVSSAKNITPFLISKPAWHEPPRLHAMLDEDLWISSGGGANSFLLLRGRRSLECMRNPPIPGMRVNGMGD
jgi:hypothetical protein